MTRNDIINLAWKVGYPLVEYDGEPYIPPLLAVLLEAVAEEEREACATVADKSVDYWVKAGYPECAEVKEAQNIAEGIRARGSNEPR